MEISKQENFSLWFFVMAVVICLSTISGIYKLPSFIYVIVIFLFFIGYVATNVNKLRVNCRLTGLFLLVCFVSVIINNPPSYFRSWERLFLFSLVVVSFSPLFISQMLVSARLKLFEAIMRVLLVFSVATFFAYFLGINYFERLGEQLDMEVIGHFSGFFCHSMVLGPLAAICTIYCFIHFLLCKIKRGKVIWAFFSIACFSSCAFSASRSSVGGVFLGGMMVIFQYCRIFKKKIRKYLAILLAVGTIASPVLMMILSGVMIKNSGNLANGGILYSRDEVFAARIIEIQENLLTGVGFASVDPNYSNVDKDTGTVEPGSSWLAVFSMTGVVGFLLFLIVYIKCLIVAMNRVLDERLSLILSGILVFWGVHMLFEGYVLAAGNFLCGLYWLTLGVIDAKSRESIF